MQWSKIPITDDNNLNVSSIAFGNGYYVALAFKSTSSTSNDMYICFTNDLNSGWTNKGLVIKSNTQLTSPGIVFAGDKFVVPFADSISNNAFSIFYFSNPEGPITLNEKVVQNSNPIAMRSVRYAGDKVVVCGTRHVDDEQHRAGCIWYCSDTAGTWDVCDVLPYSSGDDYGDCQVAAFDLHRNKFKIYAVERRDNTNYHKIFSSNDLISFDTAEEIASDQKASPAQPTFSYCKNHDALALFLHGKTYVSKAGQPFVSIPYPTGVDAESVNAATSDGTKFLASSASANQDTLSVMYSSGDPTVAANWHTQILAAGQQVSPDVVFASGSNLFLVLGGFSGAVNSTLYAAHFAASQFKIMTDRLPQTPNRFELRQDTGDYVFLKRADNPTEEGTKLSKATLLTDDAAVAVWNNTPPKVLCTPSTALQHLGKNAFHVGDILTTIRDLSGKENWAKCDGGEVSADAFPELYPLLPTGSVSDNWNTKVVDSTTFSSGEHSYCNVATDGNWYVTVCYKSVGSSNTYNWYVFYTHDPDDTWTKKEIFNSSNRKTSERISLIYADGKFSFLATDSTGQTYIVYASNPSDAWSEKAIGTAGVTYSRHKYINNQYLVFGNQTVNDISWSAYVHTFNSIDEDVINHTIFSGVGQNTRVYDVDYFNGKWLALILNVTGTNPYTYTTQLYYSENLDKVYSDSQHVQVASGSSNSAYFTPQALTCGNGYIVAWGAMTASGQATTLDVYSTSSLPGTFSNKPFSNFWGTSIYPSYPIFFDGTFYIAAANVQSSNPYIIYGSDPNNFNPKILFASGVSRVSLGISESTKTLLVGTQSLDYTTLSATWQKIGKSLPKILPGAGINAYIKVKEGD